MWKQDSGEYLKRISVGRNQESLVSEGKEKKLSLGKQGQTCELWTNQEEKDSEPKLKSKENRKNFQDAENQNLQHLKIRQVCNDYYDAYGTVYAESLKIPDKPFKGNLGSINKSINKQSQSERFILKDSDSTPSKRSIQGQSSQSSSQGINYQQQKQSKLVAKVGNISSISIEQQEALD